MGSLLRGAFIARVGSSVVFLYSTIRCPISYIFIKRVTRRYRVKLTNLHFALIHDWATPVSFILKIYYLSASLTVKHRIMRVCPIIDN